MWMGCGACNQGQSCKIVITPCRQHQNKSNNNKRHVGVYTSTEPSCHCLPGVEWYLVMAFSYSLMACRQYSLAVYNEIGGGKWGIRRQTKKKMMKVNARFRVSSKVEQHGLNGGNMPWSILLYSLYLNRVLNGSNALLHWTYKQNKRRFC